MKPDRILGNEPPKTASDLIRDFRREKGLPQGVDKYEGKSINLVRHQTTVTINEDNFTQETIEGTMNGNRIRMSRLFYPKEHPFKPGQPVEGDQGRVVCVLGSEEIEADSYTAEKMWKDFYPRAARERAPE